ncbi:MAG: hypothetical protein M1826_001114 [Phylliscum demangeonii]|nr:MAG: hypothetical protein M1826_001114 [Phylliscum demangeonii]
MTSTTQLAEAEARFRRQDQELQRLRARLRLAEHRADDHQLVREEGGDAPNLSQSVLVERLRLAQAETESEAAAVKLREEIVWLRGEVVRREKKGWSTVTEAAIAEANWLMAVATQLVATMTPGPAHGVLLGTYLHSPEVRPGRWHVVTGGFDRRHRFIRRVHNYDRHGEILPPSQLGRATSVQANAVDYEPRFRDLSDRGIQEQVARELAVALGAQVGTTGVVAYSGMGAWDAGGRRTSVRQVQSMIAPVAAETTDPPGRMTRSRAAARSAATIPTATVPVLRKRVRFEDEKVVEQETTTEKVPARAGTKRAAAPESLEGEEAKKKIRRLSVARIREPAAKKASKKAKPLSPKKTQLKRPLPFAASSEGEKTASQEPSKSPLPASQPTAIKPSESYKLHQDHRQLLIGRRLDLQSTKDLYKEISDPGLDAYLQGVALFPSQRRALTYFRTIPHGSLLPFLRFPTAGGRAHKILLHSPSNDPVNDLSSTLIRVITAGGPSSVRWTGLGRRGVLLDLAEALEDYAALLPARSRGGARCDGGSVGTALACPEIFQAVYPAHATADFEYHRQAWKQLIGFVDHSQPCRPAGTVGAGRASDHGPPESRPPSAATGALSNFPASVNVGTAYLAQSPVRRPFLATFKGRGDELDCFA